MHDIGYWWQSWAFGVPIIAVSVVVHVIGLGIVRGTFLRLFSGPGHVPRLPLVHFAVVLGGATMLATVLHVLQAGIWAAAFLLLGAISSPHDAMLYSLGAMTTFGHASIMLAPHWQMLGALEALDGLILFGLTTAFLYGIIDRVWPHPGR